jgi:phospholipase C
MGYYTAGDIPFFYALADKFAVADHSFASLLGPTGPNRSFLQAATSFGLTGLTLFMDKHLNLIDRLEDAKVTWRDYYSQLPTLGTFLESLSQHIDNITKIDYFFDDVAKGQLSQVNFVDPELGDAKGGAGERNDLHPPGNVQLGDQFLEKVIKALTTSPQWPHMAIIITFDEHGGLYDHVAPPPACPPDDLEPTDPNDGPWKFDRLGVRIPTIVISPYGKRHYVSHVNYDHTSILRLLEAKYIMPSMTARDANADPMFDLFDFSHQNLSVPDLPSVTIDQAKRDQCDMLYPPPPA